MILSVAAGASFGESSIIISWLSDWEGNSALLKRLCQLCLHLPAFSLFRAHSICLNELLKTGNSLSQKPQRTMLNSCACVFKSADNLQREILKEWFITN